jgi:hypothetical protein
MATTDRALVADRPVERRADQLFFFDSDHLAELARTHAGTYQRATPYPHIVIDDFLPADVLADVIAEFPRPQTLEWQRFDEETEVKLASDDTEAMPPLTRHLLSELNSGPVIEFLEQLTGIEGLIPDPFFWGGGMHQIERGGRLKIHSDFNWHERLRLDRRLNLLIYLNEDWDDSWGGHFELWNRDMSACEKKVAPIANRCVVFSTTDFSYHGHPDPLACPPDVTRKSLALYYYSNGRPAAEVSSARTTDFKPRPGEQWRRGNSTRAFAERWLPPAVVDGARNVRHRRSP